MMIRKAIAQDYPWFIQLYDQVDEFHRLHLPHIFTQPTSPVRTLDSFMEWIRDPRVGIFIAESGAALEPREGHKVKKTRDRNDLKVDLEILGFVHAYVQESPPSPIFVSRKYVIIDGLGVSPKVRNRGVGTRLLNQVHQWAANQSITEIEIHVYEFNTQAIHLYETMGYLTQSRKMRLSLPKGSEDGDK